MVQEDPLVDKRMLVGLLELVGRVPETSAASSRARKPGITT
jgi:hypothetical protein